MGALPWSLKLFLGPPGILLLLMAIGWGFRARRGGRRLAVVAFLVLVAAAMPAVGSWAIVGLQRYPALAPSALPDDAQAIVVLSAELIRDAPEYGGDTVGILTLQRLRYAARLQRATGLPLATTGGRMGADATPLAVAMADALTVDFGVPVRWIESGSRTTRENARLTAAILLPEGHRRILLVTTAWHMPRARDAFVAAGFDVIPAPTGFARAPDLSWGDFVPTPSALVASAMAWHEWLGRLWYGLLDR